MTTPPTAKSTSETSEEEAERWRAWRTLENFIGAWPLSDVDATDDDALDGDGS